ncbi:MAG: hypothetical protein Q9199_007170 [Rusavskia elegans]
MNDMPPIHEDPPTSSSGQKGSKEEQLEEERQMPKDERASEMEREMHESRQQAEEQRFENQQIVKSAANQIAWIQGVLKIPKYRKGMKGQRLLFQHKLWGPRGRTWATDFGTGSALIRDDLVMTEKIFQLQVGEITYFLELRNAIMMLEELLEIPVILLSTVQGRLEIPNPMKLASYINQAFKRIIHVTGRLVEVRRDLVGCLVADDVEPENIASVAHDVPAFNVFFVAFLTQTMPRGAEPFRREELDHHGIQTVMENAPGLRNSMEGWRAESDYELSHMRDQLTITWGRGAHHHPWI